MRDIGTIIFVLTWVAILIAFGVTLWIIINLDLFPLKRLRNFRFSEIKIGQVFYDYGGEELKLREYIKTGECEAKCLSVSGHPTVSFDEKDVVKIEVEKI